MPKSEIFQNLIWIILWNWNLQTSWCFKFLSPNLQKNPLVFPNIAGWNIPIFNRKNTSWTLRVSRWKSHPNEAQILRAVTRPVTMLKTWPSMDWKGLWASDLVVKSRKRTILRMWNWTMNRLGKWSKDCEYWRYSYSRMLMFTNNC